MKSVKEMLELLRDPFIEQLNNQANIFKVIGTPIESPRWFQYHCDRNEPGILFIGHSQRKELWIKLDITMFTDDEQWMLQHGDYMEIYRFFREVKYKHLKDNHPTIELI